MGGCESSVTVTLTLSRSDAARLNVLAAGKGTCVSALLAEVVLGWLAQQAPDVVVAPT